MSFSCFCLLFLRIIEISSVLEIQGVFGRLWPGGEAKQLDSLSFESSIGVYLFLLEYLEFATLLLTFPRLMGICNVLLNFHTNTMHFEYFLTFHKNNLYVQRCCLLFLKILCIFNVFIYFSYGSFVF